MADHDTPDEASSTSPRSSGARRDARPSSARPGSARRPEGDRSSRPRYGEKKPHAKREGDRKPYVPRDSDKRPHANRDGDRAPSSTRDGDRRPYAKRDGDRKPYAKRDGDKPYAKRDGDRPYAKRDGERKPYAARDGDRRPSRTGGPGQSRPTRGGANRPDRAPRAGEMRPMREHYDDPPIPDEVTARDLQPSARNELKTLSKENAEVVARHLAMASDLIDDDPALAHRHALAASRRAGRIAIVRETLAITAYATGDFALALRELRTYRRISGRDDQIALMVDSERGVGRPDRALETGRAVDRATLPTPARVELAIAMSGARLDLGEPERALQELDIPELDPDRAFEWSPGLFAARAAVLEELGRTDEASVWQRRAVVAADALDAASGAGDLETVFIEEIVEEPGEDADRGDVAQAGGDAPVDAAGASPAEDSAPSSIDDEVAEILEEAGIDKREGSDD